MRESAKSGKSGNLLFPVKVREKSGNLDLNSGYLVKKSDKLFENRKLYKKYKNVDIFQKFIILRR